MKLKAEMTIRLVRPTPAERAKQELALALLAKLVKVQAERLRMSMPKQ